MAHSEAMTWSLLDAQRYIDSAPWTFAKTMPDWPHEYTVRAWRPELGDAFVEFCTFISTAGRTEAWPPPPAPARYYNTYLVIDGLKYWAMGPQGDADPVEEKTVINRARVMEVRS